MKETSSFQELGLSQDSLSAVRKKGFTQPSPIQEKVIPLLLSGHTDIIGQAQTGTGKTAAFGLPIIEKIACHSRHVQALVLTPTRELALQVSDEIASLRGHKQLKVTSIYGGQPMQRQVNNLRQGVHIVVGTPGRILDHLRQKTLTLQSLSYCVLDEADEMLNMGFLEDVKKILSHTNSDKRNLMFSATMPDAILKVAQKYMGDYQLVQMGDVTLTAPLTEQSFIPVQDTEKFPLLCALIDQTPAFYGLVFCRTKHEAKKVAKRLQAKGYAADSLQGNLTQSQRERVMGAFRRGTVRVLVATDVASRGIDVSNLTHVINYGLPQDPESYVHRIGRTGRAGKEGKAITFVAPQDQRKLREIEKLTHARIYMEKGVEIPPARPSEESEVSSDRTRNQHPHGTAPNGRNGKKTEGFSNRPRDPRQRGEAPAARSSRKSEGFSNRPRDPRQRGDAPAARSPKKSEGFSNQPRDARQRGNAPAAKGPRKVEGLSNQSRDPRQRGTAPSARNAKKSEEFTSQTRERYQQSKTSAAARPGLTSDARRSEGFSNRSRDPRQRGDAPAARSPRKSEGFSNQTRDLRQRGVASGRPTYSGEARQPEGFSNRPSTWFGRARRIFRG